MSAQQRITTVRRLVVQSLLYLGFMGLLATLTAWPGYRHLPVGMATIKMSVRHSGKLVGACRDLSAAELAQLPANMRAPQVCPRERSPLHLQLNVNGASLVDEQVAAKGLHSDGMAAFYRRLTVPSGALTLDVRMQDDSAHPEAAYRGQFQGTVQPAQVLVIDFDAKSGQFVIL